MYTSRSCSNARIQGIVEITSKLLVDLLDCNCEYRGCKNVYFPVSNLDFPGVRYRDLTSRYIHFSFVCSATIQFPGNRKIVPKIA